MNHTIGLSFDGTAIEFQITCDDIELANILTRVVTYVAASFGVPPLDVLNAFLKEVKENAEDVGPTSQGGASASNGATEAP